MIKQSALYFSSRIINGITALLTLYILTRILTPEEYGLYTLGLTAISIVSAIGFQWISAILSRLYITNPQYILSYSIKLTYKTSAIVSIFFIPLLIHEKFLNIDTNILITIWVSSIFLGTFSLSQQLLNTQQEVKRYFLQSVFRPLITLAVAILLFKLDGSSENILYSITIGAFLSLFFLKMSNLFTLKKCKDQKTNKDIIHYGLPFIMISIVTMILGFSDRYMIAWLNNIEEVAYYSAPYDLAQQAIGATLSAFSLAFYPKIITEWEKKRVDIVKINLKKLTQLTIFLSTLFIVVFISVSEEISILVFDISFQEKTALIMPIIVLAVSIGCFKTIILDVAISLKKSSKTHLHIILLMSAINIILNYFLIPEFGGLGAAISLAIAFITGSISSWIYGKNLDIYPSFTKDIIKSITIILTIIIANKFLHIDINNEAFISLIVNLIIFISLMVTISIFLKFCEINSIIKKHLRLKI